MKQIFLLLALFSCFSVRAQQSTPGKTLLIGINFSPDYCYRSLTDHDGGIRNASIIGFRNDNELPKIGYTAGVNAWVKFSRRVGFETGIQFSNKGYKMEEGELVDGTQNPMVVGKFRFKYAYKYIGIPLKAKFSFGKGNLRVVASAGVITNFLLQAKQSNRFEYTNGRKETSERSMTSEVEKIDISPVLSGGIDYRLNKKISFVLEPTFRYGILTAHDAPIHQTLWSAGLNFACYYAFK